MHTIASTLLLLLSSYKIMFCSCFLVISKQNTIKIKTSFSILNSIREDEPDTIISPFLESTNTEDSDEAESSSSSSGSLEFTIENVDNVLEEVRPYLISDGGNCSIEKVDKATKDVYLVLEGACGSCPSSTVTMQMGIERVLRENFPDLGQVIQVINTPPEDELSVELVQFEVDRLQGAITAMGGSVKVVGVDKETGIVSIFFKGPNRIRQGLEMAVKDIAVVKDVKFVAQE